MSFSCLRLLAFCLGLVLSNSLSAQPLEVLYSRALERNEPYLTALTRAKSSLSALRQTASQAWPTVGLGFDVSVGAFPQIIGFDEGEDAENPERLPFLNQSNSFSLSIAQQIFQFGRLDAELERDDWQNRAAWLSVAQAQSQVHRDIALAYLNARSTNVLLQIRQVQLDLLASRLNTVQRRVDEGFLDRNDLLASFSELRSGQIAVVEQRRVADIARADLARVTFRAEVQVEEAALANLVGRLPSNLDQSLLFAQSNNIDILIAETLVRAARAGEWAVARSGLPSLSWNASHSRGLNYNRQFDDPFAENNGISTNGSRDTSLGISLSVPLFAGGRELERRNLARDEVQLAMRQLNATRDGILAEIRRLWAVKEAEEAALAQWFQLVGLEQERVNNAERLLEEGFTNLEDTIQARARLQELQFQVAQTSTNLANAKLEILHILGML